MQLASFTPKFLFQTITFSLIYSISMKSRKVYTLRKSHPRTIPTPQAPEQNKSDIYERQQSKVQQNQMYSQQQERDKMAGHNSQLSQMSQSNNTYGQQQSQVRQNFVGDCQEEAKAYEPLVDGSELEIDRLALKFETQLNNIQVQELKVKNIGQSAVYFEWQCKNINKINQSAIKDPKSRFYCHYENNVIKPGEEITFAFSFLSDLPGIFIQQFDLTCKPPLQTAIPPIKLEGKAFIEDEYKKSRELFIASLTSTTLSIDVHEILEDVVKGIKSPQPPLPDVSIPEIAERQFQSKNASLGLFYNAIVHAWFRQLFTQVWNKCHGIQAQQPKEDNQEQKMVQRSEEPYWDQSINTLLDLINSAEDERIDQVSKTCFTERLYHYYHLSTFPPSNKSKLFPAIREFFYNSAFKLGGDFTDAVRKELDMWEVPFREPKEDETEAELKANLEDIAKIKAEWLKKAKKKKWTEDDDKLMVEDFRAKVGQKVFGDIIDQFDGFESKAEFIKVESLLNEPANLDIEKYSDFLARLKTVKETSLEGKKIMIKFNLKLKPNSEKKLEELKEYIQLKKEEAIRIEEEKKNQEQSIKKKKAPPKKKKGKEEEEPNSKPLVFDFMSLLDEENWNGFVETYKIVQEKIPLLTFLACSYGGRQGRFLDDFSVKFLLEHLRATVDPAIQFLEHNGLSEIQEKLQNENLTEGSVYLMENINFLPCEVMQKEEQIKPESEQPQQDKPVSYQSRKLLYPQISSCLKVQLSPVVDMIISEDRFAAEPSGLMSYLFKQNIVGTLWWKYISCCMRLYRNKGSNTVIMGGDFSADKLLVLGRLLFTSQNVHNIQLVGSIGIKFSLVKRWAEQNTEIPAEGKDFYGITISKVEADVIGRFFNTIQEKQAIDRIGFPVDCVLRQLPEPPKQQAQDEAQKQSKFFETKILRFQGQNQSQEPAKESFEVCDIGPESIVQSSSALQPGHCFIFDKPTLKPYEFYQKQQQKNSLTALVQILHKQQEEKRNRHKVEQMTPSGINYDKDLVVVTIGIEQNEIETINFKDQKCKAKKAIEGDEEEEIEEQEQEEPEQEEQEGKKKIDLITDFRLTSQKCIYRLLSGNFIVGLRNIERYPKSED